MIRSHSLEACLAHGEWWLHPRQLFNGQAIFENRGIRIRDGHIVASAPADSIGQDGAPVFEIDGLASPGFFDTQINGGGGVLFNSSPTAEGLASIGAAHLAGGTTSFLPTLITDAPAIMEQAADAVIATLGSYGVVGIHLEGPHISLARKGAHSAQFIRPFDEATVSVIQRLVDAKVPVLITLAPECVPVGTIRHLTAMGVVVSLGHTAANGDTARAAIVEGAKSATHLYNGMTPITSRDAGVVGAALDSDIYCGVIADGHHVDPTVLRLAMRARPRNDRMVVVSDAMPTWGGSDRFTLYQEVIELRDGRLINRVGSLAGVHADMAGSVRYLVTHVGISREQALAMATRAPAMLMRLDNSLGTLRPKSRADLVVLNDDLYPILVLTLGRTAVGLQAIDRGARQ